MGSSVPDGSGRFFTGHEHDSGTGFDYMLARYYAGGQGRFLAVDPGSDVQVLIPQSWNRYAYVRNRPLGSVDYTGCDMDLPTAFSTLKGARLVSGSWSDYSPNRISGDVSNIYDHATPLSDLGDRFGRTIVGDEKSIGLEVSSSTSQDQALLFNVTAATFASDLMKQGVARDSAIDAGLLKAVKNFSKIEGLASNAPVNRGTVLVTGIAVISDSRRQATAINYVNSGGRYHASVRKDGNVVLKDLKTGAIWLAKKVTLLRGQERASDPIGTKSEKDPPVDRKPE